MRIAEIGYRSDRRAVHFRVDVEADIVFDIDVQVQLLDARSGVEVASHHIRQAGWDIAWLPRGKVAVAAELPVTSVPGKPVRIKAVLWSGLGARAQIVAEREAGPIEADGGGGPGPPRWSLECTDGSMDLSRMSWGRGRDNWFFKHFDHAARVIVDLICDRSPALRGRVLDVGCGDGITDLGVFLRCRPLEMIGVDPSERYRLLEDAARANGLPAGLLGQDGLRFEPQDANRLDFPDSHFDAVISWGSLEHIAGGYRGVLEEVRRVLKPGGLFFCHPGLYYGSVGNHLGEFFDDPWIHLKLDRDELRRRVLSGQPARMDRAGEVATPEQYWQWYTELNPITVEGFEAALRELGFEPWRVALRSCELVEYSTELLPHSFTDLATGELYLSAWNRK